MTIPEDMNELVDVNIDRVDLVGKAANGRRMILAKSALIDPDTVRELIKEADEPATDAAVFEDLANVLKAGRALSSANEAALRNAADVIQKVLASLPAPEAAPVEKETPVAEETTETPIETEAPEAPVEKAEGTEPEAPAEEVEKANMMAVYDATGKLVGAIKPSALTVIDSAPAAEEEAESQADEAAEEEPFEEAAADDVQPQDGAPAEAAAEDEAVIPGTETVQSPVEKGTAETPVTQAPDVAALLKEYLAPLVEKIEAVSDLAGVVDVLKERVEAIGREPDDRNSPKLNGATGEAGLAKRGADTDELTELAKSVELAKESGDPTRLANAQQAYAFESIKSRFQNPL